MAILLPYIHAVSAALLLTIAYLTHRHSNLPARLPLAIFLLLGSLWAIGALGTTVAPSMETKIALNRLKMAAIACLPVALFFTCISLNSGKKPSLLIKALVSAPSIAASALYLTPLHERMIHGYFPFPYGGLEFLGFANGPWFKYFDFYARALVIASLVYIIVGEAKDHLHSRVSRILIATAFFAPFMGDSLAVIYFPHFRFLQLTPALFLATTGVLIFGVFKYRIYGIVPFARDLVIDQSEDGFVITDADSLLLDFNPTARRIFDLGIQNLNRRFSPHSPSPHAESKVVEAGGRSFSVQKKPLRYMGNLLGELWHFRDITKQRKLIADLESINQVKTLLLGVLGHELQTHLASIALEAENLAQSPIARADHAEFAQASAESILINAKSSREFVKQALAWSKHLLNELKPERSAIESMQLAKSAARDLSALTVEKEIEIEISATGNLPALISDPFLVQTILRNLLSNAVKFADRGSIVALLLSFEENKFCFRVKNRGSGLSEEEIADILRLGRPKSSSGLGLLICRDFSRALGAELLVENCSDSGCVFTLMVPSIS